jgi:hypothetical protein
MTYDPEDDAAAAAGFSSLDMGRDRVMECTLRA